MSFHSILFPSAADESESIDDDVDPTCFGDLHLDRIADVMFAERASYELKPFFRRPLRDAGSVQYRHEVMRDLEHGETAAAIGAFAEGMRAVREGLEMAARLHYARERERWLFESAQRYCACVQDLYEALTGTSIRSRGLLAFHGYLAEYRASEAFVALVRDVASLRRQLLSVTYSVLIKGESLSVRRTQDEGDLAAAILGTFDRFRQGGVKSYLSRFHDRPGMNHIEEKILDFVAILYPDVFAELARFTERYDRFVEPAVERFDREMQFYLAGLEYARGFEAAGLPTCYPQVGDRASVYVRDGFDAALAQRLLANGQEVVCNDFELHPNERVFVVSGPNQGGKTTFARTFGQLQYLGALGLRTPGRQARTFLFDEIYTHFERGENPMSLRGKLEEDIVRIHDILECATEQSIIIMNEIFSSTTAQDASILGRNVMERILALGALGVCVTFIDELSRMSDRTVSMVGLIDSADPTVRTYKLARRPANGLAYAVSLAEKYGLTYNRLTARLEG